MIRRQWAGVWVLAVLAVLAAAGPAFAQVNTGTVLGTVKDGQGGVIPGVTVVLVSEARGTRSTPVVTNESGDFVFPNVTPETYTVEVSLESFKTLKRSGIAVSPGARLSLGSLTLEVGGAAETVEVKGQAPQVQSSSGERSFSVTTAEVTNLPIATRNFADLINLTPGVVNGNRAGDSPSTGGGSNNFMMDGVSTMEPGSNRLMVAVNVESIAEVKVLTSSYQAEYGRSSGLQVTAVTKSGSNRFSGSLYDVERNSDWYCQQQDQHPQRRPQGDRQAAGLGLFGWRSDRQARRQQQAVLLLRAGVPAAHHRQRHGPLPGADRTRAGRATSRRPPTTTATRFPFIKDPLLVRQPARRPARRRASRMAACSGRIPANRLYQTGQNILNLLPAAEHRQRAGGAELQLPADPAGTEPDVLAAGGAHRLPAVHVPARHVQVRRLGSTERCHPRVDSRVQRHADERPGRAAVVGHLELHRSTRPPSSRRTSGAPRIGRRAAASTAAAPTSATPGFRSTRSPTSRPMGWPICRPCSPTPTSSTPSYYNYDALRRSARSTSTAPASTCRRRSQWGSRITNTPPNNVYPGLCRLLGGQGFRGQPHQGLGPAHGQDRLLQAVAPPSGRTRATRSAR